MASKKKTKKSTGKFPFETKRHGGASESRKSRRQYMKEHGILKEASALRNSDLNGWSEYLRDQIDYGRRLHNEFIEDVMRDIKQQLSDKEGQILKSLTEAGLSKENIQSQLSRFRDKHRRYLTI